MIQVRRLKEDKIRKKHMYTMLQKTSNVIFFNIFFSLSKSNFILSFQYFTSLSYLSPCSLWCRKPSFHFLMFRGWKYAEDWTEISSVIRQCHTLTRWANELVNSVALRESLQGYRTIPSCVITLWVGVTQRVLLNYIKKVVAMSDMYHRLSKPNTAFCL